MKLNREIRAGVFVAGFFLFALTVFPVFGISAQQQHGEDEPSYRKGVALEPKQYWFLEALGKLENLKETDRRIEGSYESRFQRTDFYIEKDRVKDPTARTEGYKLAIEKIISYMAPGATPNNEANRKYIARLITKLKTIAGMDLNGYREWKTWFESNRDRLHWSDEKQRMVATQRM